MAGGEKFHNAERLHVTVRVGDPGDVSFMDRDSLMFCVEPSNSEQFYSRKSSGLEIQVSILIIFIPAYELKVLAYVSYQ